MCRSTMITSGRGCEAGVTGRSGRVNPVARSTVRSKPTLQLVLQGEARQLTKRLDLGHIGYEVLDQAGPLTMRIAVTDWRRIRAIAGECGYTRPVVYAQADSQGQDPFALYWFWHTPAATS